MLRGLLLLISIVFLTRCGHYYQVLETSSKSMKYSDSDSTWVFENDSIKLTYLFWARGGVMSFSIYNKLDKPIYIDWKNSSFIYNSSKLNYWVDEQVTRSLSYYGAYFYDGPLLKPGYSISEGVGLTASKTVKPERKTFIPPRSYWYRAQFSLLRKSDNAIDITSLHKKIEPKSSDPTKTTILYEQIYDSLNSPLVFRNYLAYSFSESSEDFHFVDNEFFVSSFREMEERQFKGGGHTDADWYNYTYPYRKKTSFYIEIMKRGGVREKKLRQQH